MKGEGARLLESLRRVGPGDPAGIVQTALEDWTRNRKGQRLWARDATLWTGSDENRWLDWLREVGRQKAHARELTEFREEVRAEGFTHALLLGMGGSSLGPEVIRRILGRQSGCPDLHVLDSTDPAQILTFEKKLDPARTLFIVSSKSGTTLEPNILKEYFFHRTGEAVGAEKAGSRFVAVTDPGSNLAKAAETDRFRRIFPGVPGIGGRYSVLSPFGMVPAALLGVDLERFLLRAGSMAEACGPEAAAEDNPGVALGIVLGVLGGLGRNKITILAAPEIEPLGAWLEQLLAESTGKLGRGLIPVDRESPGAPEVYGDDRVFIYLSWKPAPDPKLEATVAALERAGHPVVRIPMTDPHDLGGEFFRWEIATAVAGSLLGINPFDQPDVEASKVATRELTEEYERTGSLPEERPILKEDGVRLHADGKNAAALRAGAGTDATLAGFLRAHLRRIGPGDYFALLAYLEMNDAHDASLQSLRHAVRNARRAATCLGFGPRFLHSTGQAYKGGPNSGVFLQVTADDAADLPIPGRKATFGLVKAAQARGDFQVLAERSRRALRVHLEGDTAAGLARLVRAVGDAL